MSHQLNLADADLFVREPGGTYRSAEAGEVLDAAQRLLLSKVSEGELMQSPQNVRDFLRLRIGSLEHELFCVLHLDAQNRLIEFVEMFRGTVTQTSVYPRSW